MACKHPQTTYKCPQTIATLLTNYKIQTHKDSVVFDGSHPCENATEGENAEC